MEENDFIGCNNFIYEDILRRVNEKIFKLFLDSSVEGKTFSVLRGYYEDDI